MKKGLNFIMLLFLIAGVVYTPSSIEINASEYIPGGTGSLVDTNGEKNIL